MEYINQEKSTDLRPQFMLDNAQIAKDLGHNIWLHTVNDFQKLHGQQYRNLYEQLEYVLSFKGEITVTNFLAGKNRFNMYVPEEGIISVVFKGYPSAYYHDGDCYSVVGEDGLRRHNTLIHCRDMCEGWFDTRKDDNQLLFVLCSLYKLIGVNSECVIKAKDIADRYSAPFYVCLESDWHSYVKSKI